MASPLDNPANILIDEIEKPIDYKYYYHLFKKNVSIVITFVIIAITVSSIYAAKLPDEYRAMTQLIIEKPRAAWETVGAAESAKVDQAATSWDEDYYNTQQQIVLGSTVLRWVIKQLNLRQYFEIQNEDAIMARLRGMLQVSRVAKSRIFNIVASADDPQFVANLANAVADSYIRKNFEDSLYYNREILGWLSQGGEGTSKVITIQDPLGKIRRMKYEDLIETLPAIQSDPTIRTLIEKKNQAEADMQTLLKQYREKHPVVIKARANLKFLDESIETEKRRIIENLKTKAEGQLSVQQGRILEAAEPPERPVGPDRMRIVLLVTLGVLIANLVVLFLTDYFDDTIHVMEDLERKGILVPFLGPLPLIREKETGRKPVQLATKLSESAKVEILEAFRYLRVAINFSAPPEALKLLAITSCLPAEGKSFMSLNVAASLAMDGNKTLLVDADLRRPTIHESFDVENDTGLSNYLTGNVDFNAMVKESYIENLSLFTSGPTSPNPSEILGSDRMKLFLQDAVKVFDRVIIDCPPLTGIGDGFVIGSLIGHLILVVSAGKTPSDLIRHTQQQLDKMGIKLLGMVLNKMDVEKERYGGYTKHYYRTYNKYYRSNK